MKIAPSVTRPRRIADAQASRDQVDNKIDLPAACRHAGGYAFALAGRGPMRSRSARYVMLERALLVFAMSVGIASHPIACPSPCSFDRLWSYPAHPLAFVPKKVRLRVVGREVYRVEWLP